MNIKDTINIKQPEGGLVQSKNWADVMCAEGKKVVEISDGTRLLYGFSQKLPLVGSYVYFPRVQNITPVLIKKIKDLNYGWARIDANNKDIVNVIKESDLCIDSAPHNMQPRENLIIDITVSEKDLLAQMKSKTRYNVRLAQKKGVKIFTTHDKKYIDIFCDLVMATADRKNVTFHKREHYHKMFESLPNDIIQLYVAEYNGKVVATNIVAFYGGTATYLHGATSDAFRNVMAPFLLQWQTIKDAKEKGYRWYDLGGVFVESEDSDKMGITRFKKGFSPKTDFFVTEGSYDIVLSPIKYKIYRILQQINDPLQNLSRS